MEIKLYRGVSILVFFFFYNGSKVDCFVDGYVVVFIEVGRSVLIRWWGWCVYEVVYIIVGKVCFWRSICGRVFFGWFECIRNVWIFWIEMVFVVINFWKVKLFVVKCRWFEGGNWFRSIVIIEVVIILFIFFCNWMFIILDIWKVVWLLWDIGVLFVKCVKFGGVVVFFEFVVVIFIFFGVVIFVVVFGLVF